jgi:predicted nicotinamide N-methyase
LTKKINSHKNRFALISEAIDGGDGVRLSLFALPLFASLIRRDTAAAAAVPLRLLDIGAGPTIYSALCFREVASEVWLSDYLPRKFVPKKLKNSLFF